MNCTGRVIKPRGKERETGKSTKGTEKEKRQIKDNENKKRKRENNTNE